jgi:hypothetical protein
MFAYWEGKLIRGGDVHGHDLVGWDHDALHIVVGDVQLTLHPDHFADAAWSEDKARLLKIVMGRVELEFRAAPTSSS